MLPPSACFINIRSGFTTAHYPPWLRSGTPLLSRWSGPYIQARAYVPGEHVIDRRWLDDVTTRLLAWYANDYHISQLVETRHRVLDYEEAGANYPRATITVGSVQFKVWDDLEAMVEGLPLAFMLDAGAALVKLGPLN